MNDIMSGTKFGIDYGLRKENAQDNCNSFDCADINFRFCHNYG